MKRPKPIKKISGYFRQIRHPSIREVVRETTAGGVVYRRTAGGQIEVVLIQDAKDRWTIPKGHVEPGESPRQTAIREIAEETGLKHVRVDSWIGKIEFRYRRQSSLVLMTTQIYLVEALGNNGALRKEEIMNGIRWFPAMEAFDIIEYEDIGKLILLGLKKLRHPS